MRPSPLVNAFLDAHTRDGVVTCDVEELRAVLDQVHRSGYVAGRAFAYPKLNSGMNAARATDTPHTD